MIDVFIGYKILIPEDDAEEPLHVHGVKLLVRSPA